jgi:hypothetical protein
VNVACALVVGFGTTRQLLGQWTVTPSSKRCNQRNLKLIFPTILSCTVITRELPDVGRGVIVAGVVVAPQFTAVDAADRVSKEVTLRQAVVVRRPLCGSLTAHPRLPPRQTIAHQMLCGGLTSRRRLSPRQAAIDLMLCGSLTSHRRLSPSQTGADLMFCGGLTSHSSFSSR